MATFKKNLLEAFQDANDERSGGNPVSGGPFAGPVADEPSVAPRPSLLPELSLRDSRTLLIAVGGALILFIAGLAVGRWLGAPTSASAAEHPVSSAPAEPEPEMAAAPARDPLVHAGEEVNAALLDARNSYTVLAVTYEDEARWRDLAYSTYFHLSGLGLPVAYPVSSDGKIYVLVGAAPTKDELTALRDRVRGARDPDGREGEYRDAYVVSIDATHLR